MKLAAAFLSEMASINYYPLYQLFVACSPYSNIPKHNRVRGRKNMPVSFCRPNVVQIMALVFNVYVVNNSIFRFSDWYCRVKFSFFSVTVSDWLGIKNVFIFHMPSNRPYA